MPAEQVWTVGRLLRWTTDYLKQKGSDSPRLDAELLLAHAMQCRRIDLYTAFESQPADEVKSEFRKLVQRRAGGEPVAYIVGHREFYSLSFLVDQNVLVPRPETELLVVTLIDRARQRDDEKELLIADVGTGSGAIAVTIAKQLPQARVTAIDISEAALDIARRNLEVHDVADRIELLHGDLLAPCQATPLFDFVVSNPPYVSEGEMRELSADVANFEPHQALCGGPTGTEVILRLVQQAAERLRNEGVLLFEISPMIEAAARELVEHSGRFDNIEVVRDLGGLPRVLVADKRG